MTRYDGARKTEGEGNPGDQADRVDERDARTRILEEGGRLVHALGFNNAGLSEILRAAGVPKGSFYHYFPSKEEFGLALVDYYLESLRTAAARHLVDPDLAPVERLLRFFRAFMDIFEMSHYELGCPVGNLVQEMSNISPLFRERLDALLAPMEDGITAVVAEIYKNAGGLTSQETTCNAPDRDPRRTARFILASWQGAVMMMKLERSRQPLEIFEEMVFRRLLV